MQISEQKVVLLNYEVVDDQGQLIDRSEEGGPLAYIHGTGQLIPGLETALEGRGQGDKIEVDVPPDQGYGERSDEGVQTVSRNQFDDDAEIDEVAWVPFAELHDRLSYADERELLSRVPELLASAS